MDNKYYEELFEKNKSFLDKRLFSNKELEWLKSKLAGDEDVMIFGQIAREVYESGFYN